ncbi:MAG: fibronectin type III domain-containing protein, partial [Limisphaerales bacterium]
FATSENGRYAFSQTKIYDTVQKTAVLGMPATTSVSAFNSTSRKLVLQTGGALGFFEIAAPFSLSAPVLSAATTNSDSVVLNWTDRSLEESFTLQQRPSGASNWTDIATPGRNVTQQTVTGLSPETAYEFRIKADTAGVSSPWSSTLPVTTPAAPPTTPFLNTPAATAESVALSWSNPGYETAIILERSTGSTSSWTVLATLAADTTVFADTDVVSQTSYYYRVKSRNGVGDSAYSIIRSVVVPAPQPPAAPDGLVAKTLSASSLLVSWSDVASETGYQLERRTESTNSWQLAASLSANTTSYTDASLVQGTQYWYRVRAFNTNGSSLFSIEASAVPFNAVTLIADNFDSGLSGSTWTGVSGGVATNGGAGFRTGNSLYFSASGERSATTLPLDVSTGGSIEFLLRTGNEAVDGNAFWNNSETGEAVVLEYSRDNGTNWTTIQVLNTVYPSLSNWTSFSVTIPGAALGPDTQFRWRQLASSGTSMDCWALDDVVIQGAIPPPPSAVPFVISSSSSATSIALFWVGAGGASTYRIERMTGVENWVVVATVTSSTTFLTDTALSPNTAYTYRIQAVNAGGAAPYSPTTTTLLWSRLQEWVNSNYGRPDALSDGDIVVVQPDGSRPLLRYAFNLSASEQPHDFQPGETNGYPSIRVDSARNRLCIEFVRRRASTQPGIVYQVEFSPDLVNWSTNATLVSTTPIDSNWERVRYEDVLNLNQASFRYSRVTVRR